MSASAMERSCTEGQDIPIRRLTIHNEADMPDVYSSTPGGTIFGTTPGGTKIIYERAFLMEMRNSPMARTPPKNLPKIPGVTCDLSKSSPTKGTKDASEPKKDEKQEDKKKDDDDQFSMDI